MQKRALVCLFGGMLLTGCAMASPAAFGGSLADTGRASSDLFAGASEEPGEEALEADETGSANRTTLGIVDGEIRVRAVAEKPLLDRYGPLSAYHVSLCPRVHFSEKLGCDDVRNNLFWGWVYPDATVKGWPYDHACPSPPMEAKIWSNGEGNEVTTFKMKVPGGKYVLSIQRQNKGNSHGMRKRTWKALEITKKMPVRDLYPRWKL